MPRFIEVRLVGDGYEVTKTYRYHSSRYDKHITIHDGFFTDGATMVPDPPNTDAWVIHDHICRYGVWDDGSKIDNWTASTIFYDVLIRDGYHGMASMGRIGTWLLGGGAARKNGMLPQDLPP